MLNLKVAVPLFRLGLPLTALGQCWLASWILRAVQGVDRSLMPLWWNVLLLVVNVVCAAINLRTAFFWWRVRLPPA